MKRVLLLTAFALLGITVSIAFSQPPGGRGPGGGGPGFGPPPNPVLEALDADGDHEISAQEIQTAAASLKKLDKNRDGKLTHDELHPEMPGGRPGFAPQRGPGGLGQGRPQGPHAGGPEGPGMRRPAGPGPEGSGQGRDRGGPAGRPSPEQFVEHALRFDADQDGKLDKDELLKLAEQIGRGPQAGRRPGEHGGRPDGEQPAHPRRPASE